MTTTKSDGRASEAWLRRMADAEDACAAITVGGLAHQLGLFRREKSELNGTSPVLPEAPRVLGRFLEYARRARGYSVEKLAKEADIDLGELVAIEREEDVAPTPRTVYRLATVLKVDTGKLMVVAGLADAADNSLNEAALKFAARSEPTAELSKAEREAFEEFVKVLVERTDGV